MHYREYKTILSPKNGMNLYRGCTHGCIYCDSRSKCYQMDHDFEDIEIKQNAVQILESQLVRKRKPCMISTGAMCDPYIPLEQHLQLTRQCLELVLKYGFGQAILTKSTGILRDLDILKAINANTRCVVQTTLTTFDESLCKILEPHVSTTYERFRMLETMRNAGIPTVVWLSPILPFINDTKENLLGLLDYCVKAKVQAILCFGFGVTLREGDREYFYQKLDQHFPGIKNQYMASFGNAYQCDSPNNARLMQVLKTECQKHGILCGTNSVFEYMARFESKNPQLSLF